MHLYMRLLVCAEAVNSDVFSSIWIKVTFLHTVCSLTDGGLSVFSPAPSEYKITQQSFKADEEVNAILACEVYL